MAKKKQTSKRQDKYTDPKLRDRIKKKITKSSKGGKPGQWSARKAQLMAQEYKQKGGGYSDGGPDDRQKSLKKWTGEKWQTADGKKAQRKGGTARYLPKKAWEDLPESEKKATNKKKQSASRSGKQFVSNTPKAKAAGAAARKGKKKTSATKKKTKKKATTTRKKKTTTARKKKSTVSKKKTSRKKTASKTKRGSKKKTASRTRKSK